MRLKNIDFNSINEELKMAEAAAKAIRKHLGLSSSMKLSELYDAVIAELSQLNFKIAFSKKIINIQGMGHLPSITLFNHSTDRKRGGIIFIYDEYSAAKKRELLFHEYVHIYDQSSPLYSTNHTNLFNRFMLSKQNFLENVELKTDLTTLALMIPPAQLEQNLFKFSYNIEKIVKQYSEIEKSRVLEWITLHDCFPGHYALLFIWKNGKFLFKLDEYCHAHYGSSRTFDILNVLNNSNSVAWKNLNKKVSCLQDSSVIDKEEYYCFSFYEENVHQPLPLNPGTEELVICDKLVIIGWPKKVYDVIQKLQIKP